MDSQYCECLGVTWVRRGSTAYLSTRYSNAKQDEWLNLQAPHKRVAPNLCTLQCEFFLDDNIRDSHIIPELLMVTINADLCRERACFLLVSAAFCR
jgi:hypothetical protein